MSSVAQNIRKIKHELPSSVRLVAISKKKPVSVIDEAYQAGHRVFGENQVQELADKKDQLPGDIEWHMVGHLQRNKVKYIAPFVSLIHSIDSLRLLQEVNKQAQKYNRTIDCLLQVHIACEDTKFGFDEQKIRMMLESEEFQQLQQVKIKGLMGMATLTENNEQIRSEFKHLQEIFKRLQSSYFAQDAAFCEKSIGMSSDYHLAIEEGSTLVRIGSHIFGSR